MRSGVGPRKLSRLVIGRRPHRQPGALRQRDRRVADQSRRRKAVVERGQKDERLDRRPGLPIGLGRPVELADGKAEAAADRQHPPGMRVDDDERAGHFGHLAQGEAGGRRAVLGGFGLGGVAAAPGFRAGVARGRQARRRLDRGDHDDIAGLDHIAGAARKGSDVAAGVARPGPAHLGERDLPGVAIGKADRRLARHGAQHHRQAPADIGRDRRHRDRRQMRRPIVLGVDMGDRTAPAFVTVIISDQPVAQRLVGFRLEARVEAGAHRQAGLVQRLLAIAREQLAADLLGEIGRLDLAGLAPMVQLDRLRLGRIRRRAADIAVLDHAVEHPVAARRRRLRKARRVVAVRRLWQSAEKGRLAEAQLVERFVEIGHRRGGDAVGARAEIDFVQIEFEDAVLGQRRLDPGGEQDLLNFAGDRDLAGQQHVLGDLLGDRRGSDRPATPSQPADIGEARRAGSTRGRCRDGCRSFCPRPR